LRTPGTLPGPQRAAHGLRGPTVSHPTTTRPPDGPRPRHRYRLRPVHLRAPAQPPLGRARPPQPLPEGPPMTQLNTLIEPADMAAAVEAGHITRRQHPTLPLSIYTYTRTAQYSRAWTLATIQCRGLIADDKTGEIVAWPFPK